MLGSMLDVFRMRQYFDVIVGVRDTINGVRDDVGFLDDARACARVAAVRLLARSVFAVPIG